MEDKIEAIRALHEVWCIGDDDAAEDASNRIMEALSELLAKLERYDDALDEIAAHYNGGITGPGRQQADNMRAIARAALETKP